MDYYQLLRLSAHASTKDIEEAYQRLVKESRYDSSIDLRDIATAYRILSDSKQKAAYDNLVKAKGDRNVAYTATMARKKKPRVPAQFNRKQLLLVLVALFLITTGYYAFRFNYVLNEFSPGDELWVEGSNQKLGVIVRHEIEHNFGGYHEGAYLVHTQHGDIWYSAAQLKMRCHTKTNDPSL